MTIAKRIMLLISISVAALLLLGIGSLIGLKQMDNKLENVNENMLPSVITLNEITHDMFRLRLRVQSHLMSDDMDKQKGFEAEIKKLNAEITEELDKYEKTMIYDEEDRRLVGADREAIKATFEVLDKALTMSKNLQKTDAQNFLLENDKVAKAATKALTEHVKYNVELANKDKLDSKALYSKMVTAMIVLIVIAVACVGFLGMAIYKNVVTSLSSLRDTLVSVENNLDFTKRAPVMSNDEVGATVEAVNRLTSKLQNSLREIAEQSDRVSASAKHLTETARTVTDSASNQSAAAADMAATVEEMTVSINHVADQAGEANQLSSESGALAIGGEKTIIETVEDINEIATTVRSASTFVTNLETDSQRVNEVVGVIKEIADQTNLLALNAAIEAARAGE